MRVVQVSLVRPRGGPDPETVLEAWPTLSDVALATHYAGAEEVTVVQAFDRDAETNVGGVRFQFAKDLRSAVAACRPDVIHVHGLDFAWQTRQLCKLGVPVLAQDHCSNA